MRWEPSHDRAGLALPAATLGLPDAPTAADEDWTRYELAPDVLTRQHLGPHPPPVDGDLDLSLTSARSCRALEPVVNLARLERSPNTETVLGCVGYSCQSRRTPRSVLACPT